MSRALKIAEKLPRVNRKKQMLLLRNAGMMAELAFLVTVMTAVLLIGNFDLPAELFATQETQTIIRSVVGLSLLYTGFNTYNVTYECAV